MRFTSHLSRLIVTAAVLCLVGCSTHADRLRGVRAEFYSGDLGRATESLDKVQSRHKRDSDVFKLDRAILELAAGRPKEAEQLLREVRDQFDYLEQSSLAEHAWAMATDDQRIAYSGEDYEKVLIRVFLALANLMSGGEDAAAYALQVAEKQQQIMDGGKDETGKNPKLAYQRVAVGQYLHGLLREETHTNYEDAERSYQKVVEWAPQFAPGRQDLERAKSGRHSQPGNGVLYVFTLIGRGPYKEERIEVPTTVALLVADRIVSHNAGHTLPPTIAPIKVPRVVRPVNDLRAVAIAVDGKSAGQTETIMDIGQFAVDQFDAIFPHIMGRAIARRVLKKGVVYASKEVIANSDDPVVSFALDAAGVAWEATEAADTRSWGLLPDKIQLLRVELPVGRHRISLQPMRRAGGTSHGEQLEIEIEEGRNTYVLANFPNSRMVGRMLSSKSD